MEVVPGAGIEPARSFDRGILSPLCLPIPPPGLNNNCHIIRGGEYRSRTGLNGVAVHCIAALLTRHNEQKQLGAGNETRTRDPNLGKVVLYQLSYSRILGYLNNA